MTSAAPSAPVLEARGLVRHFKQVKAVDGVSFAVAPGVCFGLLGPNGAGKSTTIEMLEGLLRPDAGEVLFRGAPIRLRGGTAAHYRERIGIQFQNTALQDFLTVRENLRYFGALYETRVPMEQLVERCHLAEFLDRDTRKLSGGQRQRVLLAIALVNDPELLFLDEPTTGLDPQARRNFWELVEDIKRRGKTVVLTTHYMEEAYRLCDDIAIVDHGRIIARGSPQALLAEHFDDVVVELPAPLLAGRGGWSFEWTARAGQAEIMTGDVKRTLEELLASGLPLGELRIRPRTLEDLFIELTGHELRS